MMVSELIELLERMKSVTGDFPITEDGFPFSCHFAQDGVGVAVLTHDSDDDWLYKPATTEGPKRAKSYEEPFGIGYAVWDKDLKPWADTASLSERGCMVKALQVIAGVEVWPFWSDGKVIAEFYTHCETRGFKRGPIALEILEVTPDESPA